MIVLLDNIRSKHNVGSIFRTADACGGVEKIFLCGITPAPIDKWGNINTGLTKVALGADEYISWESVTDTLTAIKKLKADGYTILALELHTSAIFYDELPFTQKQLEKTALIVGNEVYGLAPEVLALSDTIVQIPMRGKKESLNVAVAFGIVVYALI